MRRVAIWSGKQQIWNVVFLSLGVCCVFVLFPSIRMCSKKSIGIKNAWHYFPYRFLFSFFFRNTQRRHNALFLREIPPLRICLDSVWFSPTFDIKLNFALQWRKKKVNSIFILIPLSSTIVEMKRYSLHYNLY